MKLNDKISSPIKALAIRIKIVLLMILIYFCILISYDLIIFKREVGEMLLTYISLILIGIFIWFGIRIVFYIQIKNDSCPKKIYNMFVAIALVVFGLGSIMLCIEYFLEGFLMAAFWGPIAFISVLRAQFIRK